MAKNKIIDKKVVMTTRTASESEKYRAFGVENIRKLLRQGKLPYWHSNPKYFWEEDLIQAIENEKQSNKTELLKWN